MKDPRRQQPMGTLRAERRRQPVSAALNDLGPELCETAAPQAAVGLRAETQTGGRPQFGAEHAEHELRLRTDACDRLPPGCPVTCRESVELRCVCVGVRREERAVAVREQRARWVLGVQVLQAALGQSRPELGMRRAADPEWMPGAEDVVMEAGIRQVGGAHRAAQLRFALDDGDAPACAREECRAGK